MTKTEIKHKLISAGVKNLKGWGYPSVDNGNILTDEVYKSFFKSMLNDNKGNGKQIDEAIDELLKEIEQ